MLSLEFMRAQTKTLAKKAVKKKEQKKKKTQGGNSQQQRAGVCERFEGGLREATVDKNMSPARMKLLNANIPQLSTYLPAD